jgi:hypothetical protein
MPQNQEVTRLHKILKSILFHVDESWCFKDLVAKVFFGVDSKSKI